MLRRALLLALTVFLGGCVSFHPLPEGYTGRTAYIYDTKEDVSATKVHFFELAEVDGRRIETSSYATLARNQGRGMSMIATIASRRIPDGNVKLKLSANTYVAATILRLGGEMYKIEGIVEVTLDKDTIYRVAGRLSKDYKAVWLETEEGIVISKKIEEGLFQPPPNHTP